MDRTRIGTDGKVALIELATGQVIRRYPVDAVELTRPCQGRPAEYALQEAAAAPAAQKAAASDGGEGEGEVGGPTVPELRKRAQDLNVDGFQQMSRAELAEAVAKAEAEAAAKAEKPKGSKKAK